MRAFGFYIGLLLLNSQLTGHAEDKPQAAPKVWSLTGRVLVASNDLPAKGVTLKLWSGTSVPDQETTTNEQGEYTFANVPPGDHYRIWIERRPDDSQGIWSDEVAVHVQDRPVRAPDLFLTLPQSLSGTVVDNETGLPVAGASINFSSRYNRHSIVTDKHGRYRLYVEPREVALHSEGRSDRYYRTTTDQTVTVKAGEHATAETIRLQSAPKFEGTVLDKKGQPVENVKINISMTAYPTRPRGGFGDATYGNTFHQVRADERGRFSIYLLGFYDDGVGRNAQLTIVAHSPDRLESGVAITEVFVIGDTTQDPNHLFNFQNNGNSKVKMSGSHYVLEKPLTLNR